MYHLAVDAVVILDVFKKQTEATRSRLSTPESGGWWSSSVWQERRRRRAVRKDKRRRLVRAGWRIGDAADFLQLSDEERQFIETKLALASGLRQWREDLGLTQTDVARRVGSSQSRVAKI